MPTLFCTFVSDGSADAALLPLIRWTVEQHAGGRAAEVAWADLSRVRRRPATLADRIIEGSNLYPCEILFVHRDAEAQPYDWREREMAAAIEVARQIGLREPHVCLIPVRMQEAWLLLEESAIRRAAGNPNGTARLALPAAGRIEDLPDPKRLLYDLLCVASERAEWPAFARVPAGEPGPVGSGAHGEHGRLEATAGVPEIRGRCPRGARRTSEVANQPVSGEGPSGLPARRATGRTVGRGYGRVTVAFPAHSKEKRNE